MSEGKKDSAPWTGRRVAALVAKAIVGAVGLWSGAITIIERHGAELTGFLAWTAGNSWWLLPLSALGCGIWLGWSLKRRQMASDNITAERIADLEKENTSLKSSIEVLKSDTVERFLGELPFVKLMAMDSFDHDGIADPHNFIFDYLVDENILDCANDFFIQESLVPEGTRWILRPDIRYAISDDPSLLRFAREARDRGDEGDYDMFTVLEDRVVRDDAMYMKRMGFYVPEE
ncbi:hypothetical protein [Adlercreutzia caecimuris]|uniref:Uncharacterized protein n=1 Tax=Adlercreutzia caecimuris TaxID=671266 RepID=A0A4S4G2Y8_9ACTN|nr:hypothetical protein [Adlercreutzia caecimuris]THG36882.1 hypothetical protein E5986_08245 [Adlercreutzia caecimuris]